MFSKPFWRRVAQCIVLLGAAIFALNLIDRQPASPTTASENAPFDMLGYIDQRIAEQEDRKDVRCWSSVNKLQMFLCGIPIEPAAIGIRVEHYVDLIDQVRADAAKRSLNQPIGEEHLMLVLRQRFPHQVDEQTNEVAFDFGGGAEPVLVLADAVTDYSDTIESWRLLQTWGVRNTDRSGQFVLEPTFTREAVDTFQRFLVAYDIALLQRAKQIANQHGLAVVDAPAMSLAFGRELD